MNLPPLLDHGLLLLSTEHHVLCEKLQSLGLNTLQISVEGKATLPHGHGKMAIISSAQGNSKQVAHEKPPKLQLLKNDKYSIWAKNFIYHTVIYNGAFLLLNI